MKNLLTTLLLIAKSLIHSDLHKNNLLPSYYFLLPLTTLFAHLINKASKMYKIRI